LNEESCRDLIDAFLSAKKQRIPAIVRRLKDDPDYDFEIIAGVRRWWTVQWLREHHHPEYEYLVTIQNVSDEEAFRFRTSRTGRARISQTGSGRRNIPGARGVLQFQPE
jgi:hypothetical protein